MRAIAIILSWTCFALAPLAAETVYRCVGLDGKVSFQQRKCEAAGEAVDVSPANRQVKVPERPDEFVRVPSAKGRETSKAAAEKSLDVEATPSIDVLQFARGRLDGFPKLGHRLTVGMPPAAVIEAWGRPHEVVSHGPTTLFFHYCDLRTALFWKGRLASWSALFEDSQRGTALFSYGESWKAASTKWGYQRNHRAFMFSGGARGEIQEWSPQRWIVTNAEGGIVSWCDAADHRPPTPPPTVSTPWER